MRPLVRRAAVGSARRRREFAAIHSWELIMVRGTRESGIPRMLRRAAGGGAEAAEAMTSDLEH